MATLTGQKVKDSYQSILKLDSGTLTTSNKVVEDGAGNDSALSLSTTDVQVNGTLNFGTTPSSSSTELSVLLVDGSTGDVVTRELSSSAFSGASVSVASPIVLSSGNVTIANAGTLSALTALTAASDDKFLIWDESVSAWKQISYGAIVSAGGGGTGINMMVARAKTLSTITSGGTFSTISYSDVVEPATAISSVYVGSGANYALIESTTISNDTLTVLSPGTYHIDITVVYGIAAGNTTVTARLFDLTAGTVIATTTEDTSAGSHIISFFHVVTVASENRYQVQVTCGNSEGSVSNKSQVTVTYLT